MVTKVEYFNSTTSLGVSVQSPFTLTLNNLAAGTYQISVKVTTTDPANPVLQSAPLVLTVGTEPGAATAYFIHTDQLNTPRAITNGNGNLVWRWESDPFGKEAANEEPAGQPPFAFNQRFPGQQFDRESNLHCNYFRDYDPQSGRYVQSDPIGMQGGVNTYVYVRGNPVSLSDPSGLDPSYVGRPEGAPNETPGTAFIRSIFPGSSPSATTPSQMSRPVINGSVGAGGSGHVFSMGISADAGFAGDSNGNYCVYSNICSTVGPGVAGGLGITASGGTGALSSGETDYLGVFWTGGAGLAGSGQVVRGSDGSNSAGRAIGGRAGVGGGKAAGVIGCRMTTICFRDPPPQACPAR